MTHKPYVDAVNNLEAMIKYIEEKDYELDEKLIEVLKYNIYTLKIQPQYQGGLIDTPQQEAA